MRVYFTNPEYFSGGQKEVADVCVLHVCPAPLLQVVMEYVGGGSVSSLLRNPDCGPVRGEVSEGSGEGEER